MEDIAERVSEARLLEVDNVLKDVVAEGILNKMEGAVGDLTDELGFLVTGGVIYATLQHATAMTMGSNGHAVGANSIKDELPLVNEVLPRHEKITYLSIFRGETIQTFLNDMIAIQVLDELYYLTIESIDDGLNLLGRRDEFYHLLQSARTMAVQSDLDHLRGGVVDQDCTLLII